MTVALAQSFRHASVTCYHVTGEITASEYARYRSKILPCPNTGTSQRRRGMAIARLLDVNWADRPCVDRVVRGLGIQQSASQGDHHS